MNDMYTPSKPPKLTPVLIGGGAMTLSFIVPGLNFLNCICCAGIMGSAILGVWFYKKSFPADMPFTVGDGAIIGTLSGVAGAVMSTIAQTIMMGVWSSGLNEDILNQIEAALDQAASQGSDPVAIDAVEQLVMSVIENPLLIFVVVFVMSLVVFVAFGALGGLIGGNIFKTKIVAELPHRTEN